MNLRYAISMVVIVSVILLFDGCKSDDDEPQVDTPVIESFSPTSGILMDEVTINGKNFNTSKDLNIVKFNGIIAEVLTFSPTQLKVAVPASATTGPITVEVLQKVGKSETDFMVPTPEIIDVTPLLGGEGLPVVITGENFSVKTPTLNIVKFNGTIAEVLNASANALEVAVPAGATTGKVTVEVGVNKGTSAEEFEICNDAELIIVSATAELTDATNTHAIIVVKNVGKQTIDLTQWAYQNYASKDNMVGDDAGGGGSFIFENVTLETGEQYTIHAYAGLSNSSLYNYFIINLYVPNGETVAECYSDNNSIIVPLEK
ncbi:IPT/TIG domain-containing protein [Pseudochryseolinea flava]|uniref:IPT/TIG domain-containing protein n=1 Tax=Pseudochryseolinea flava TaxID=2059302 RepID=A0A364XYD9_9BACT|nr:IPT/TIG domain-containing protein [Pseudochryseolinea flava]RAV98812.1 hypothetical protein DQQ10_22625 [Pseudochryseolinea flava]